MTALRIGLVVNPRAGVGGPVGLKGSDRADAVVLACKRGGTPRAQERAVAALRALNMPVLTVGGPMGATAAEAAGIPYRVVCTPPQHTTGADTSAATAAVVAAGAQLVLVVGGDGTLRDAAAAHPPAVLGVPAGVKMYSAAFAVSPAAAGGIARAWAEGSAPLAEREILDVDESRLDTGPVTPTVYALVHVPVQSGRTQARKAPTPVSEAAAQSQIAQAVVEDMRPEVTYFLGPGSTMAAVGMRLGCALTPLGVDAVRDGAVVVRDAGERELLAAVAAGPCRAVVTVIGGQGFLLGRGNQQFTPRVLRAMLPNPLLVAATEDKLIALRGAPLLVDTGDGDLDRMLSGYVSVITGIHTRSTYRIAAAE